MSLILAWGKNFETINNLIFDYLPGYRSFRAVSMGLVMAQLAMPLLAALALSRILRPRELAPAGAAPVPGAAPLHPALAKAARAASAAPAEVVGSPENQYRTRQLLYAGAVVTGVLLLIWLASFSFDFNGPQDASLTQAGYPAPLLSALRADRADLLRNDVWRGLLLVGLALGAIYLYLKGKIDARVAALGVVSITLFDLWTVDKRYLGARNFQTETIAESFQETPADKQIDADQPQNYRVLNLSNPFNEANTSYFHHSIGGYHGAKLRRYQDLIERQISNNNTGVLNMLNTRYVLVPPQKQGETEQVQRNPGANGNAWFVQQLRAVQTPDQEMNALTGLNTHRVAVVDVSKFPLVKPATYADSSANITLTSYAPDALTYKYAAAQPGTVVFSEIYYADGWQAYLDGQPVPHFRVDFVLRAMQVPAGTHEIKFAFEPKEYAIGNTVSLVSSIGVLLAVVAASVYGFRQKKEEGEPV